MDFNTFSFASRIGDKDFPLLLRRMVPQNVTVMHCHEFTELVVVHAGEGDHFNEAGEGVRVAAGDIFVIPQGRVYHRYDQLDNLCLVNILFDKNLLPLPLLDASTMPGFNLLFNGKLEAFRIDAERLPRLLELVGQLEDVLKSREGGYQFVSMALFMQVVHFIAKAIGEKLVDVKSTQASVAQALGCLHRRFADPALTIEDLAAMSSMSMSTLLRHFKRQTGCAPKEYLLKLRLQAACELLTSSALGVSEVAGRCGFEDSNYFSHKFREKLKLSPGEYRNKVQAGRRS